jgi:GxxExxY protein
MTQMHTDKSSAESQDSQTFEIIGAAMAVHTELGTGFLERVYQEAFIIELESRNIPYECEVALPIKYKGTTLDTSYRADIICYSNIILELKAISDLTEAHLSQIINYLKATGYQRGLLFNFGSQRLEYRRVAN